EEVPPLENNVTVLIPTPLREFTDGESEVTAEGDTVEDIINSLEENHPGIKERICTDDGELREFLNIYLDDEDIRFKDELETEIEDDAEISIIPAIAGG
ncbi:MAG: ubiquitin-like small modifier protein 1, partial [bacterium]